MMHIGAEATGGKGGHIYGHFMQCHEEVRRQFRRGSEVGGDVKDPAGRKGKGEAKAPSSLRQQRRQARPPTTISAHPCPCTRLRLGARRRLRRRCGSRGDVQHLDVGRRRQGG